MNNRLEQFVRDNREEFDGEEPADKIWDKIQLQLDPPAEKKPATIISIRIDRTWLSVAAAVILVMASGIWYVNSRHNTNTTDFGNTALQRPTAPATRPAGTTPAPATQTPSDTTAASVTTVPKDQLAAATPKNDRGNAPAVTEDETMKEEMYHYARLVELKHKELKTIEKDEPLLYRQFASDVHKLDSVYQGLQHELPKNPNREQLLEAMIQNLQLQMGLLNHQLDIIKQINNTKKTTYEKAYKTT